MGSDIENKLEKLERDLAHTNAGAMLMLETVQAEIKRLDKMANDLKTHAAVIEAKLNSTTKRLTELEEEKEAGRFTNN